MNKTEIEWADAHWEPVGGCTDVSEGCAHCYSRERVLPRLQSLERYKGLITRAPKGADRARRWTGKMTFWTDRLLAPLSWKKSRGRVFVCSQSDLFAPLRPYVHIAAVWTVMANCPATTFLVLTKHAQRLYEFLSLGGWGCEAKDVIWDSAPVWARAHRYPYWPTWPLSNVWLGVSVETQTRAQERIPRLLDTPAAKHFVSYEPALGPLDLQYQRSWLEPFHETDPLLNRTPRLDWVIAGAESAPGKRPGRPADLEWFRSVRDQCANAGTPFFLKQLEVKGKIVGTPELDGRQWTEVPR